MASGVTVLEPHRTRVDADVSVGADTVIHPDVTLLGRSAVGAGCTLSTGPGCATRRWATGRRIEPYSVLDGAEVGPGCRVGPFARLRPGTRLEEGARVGNFVEVKSLAPRSRRQGQSPRLPRRRRRRRWGNVGAGIITCNYDGEPSTPRSRRRRLRRLGHHAGGAGRGGGARSPPLARSSPATCPRARWRWGGRGRRWSRVDATAPPPGREEVHAPIHARDLTVAAKAHPGETRNVRHRRIRRTAGGGPLLLAGLKRLSKTNRTKYGKTAFGSDVETVHRPPSTVYRPPSTDCRSSINWLVDRRITIPAPTAARRKPTNSIGLGAVLGGCRAIVARTFTRGGAAEYERHDVEG